MLVPGHPEAKLVARTGRHFQHHRSNSPVQLQRTQNSRGTKVASMQEENRAEAKETKEAKARKARVRLRTQQSQPTLQGSVLSTQS